MIRDALLLNKLCDVALEDSYFPFSNQAKFYLFGNPRDMLSVGVDQFGAISESQF
jgi:hypothetical protein